MRILRLLLLIGAIAEAITCDAQAATPDSLGPIRQVDAGVLNVGYAETGPADGAPVILLHGWPYDIHSYEEVAPILAKQGYHVLIPMPGPTIGVPAITLEGDANGAAHPEPSAYAKKFVGKYEHRQLTGGIGHNLPQEAPEAFARRSSMPIVRDQ